MPEAAAQLLAKAGECPLLAGRNRLEAASRLRGISEIKFPSLFGGAPEGKDVPGVGYRCHTHLAA